MPSNVRFSHSNDLILLHLDTRNNIIGHLSLCPVNKMELRNLWNSLFGSGRTDIRKEPIKIEAEPEMDSTIERPQQGLSLDEEILVLARHYGGLVSGTKLTVDLRELLDLLYRKRRKADAYYALGKKLKDEYGVELVITSRSSKNKEDNDKKNQR